MHEPTRSESEGEPSGGAAARSVSRLGRTRGKRTRGKRTKKDEGKADEGEADGKGRGESGREKDVSKVVWNDAGGIWYN